MICLCYKSLEKITKEYLYEIRVDLFSKINNKEIIEFINKNPNGIFTFRFNKKNTDLGIKLYKEILNSKIKYIDIDYNDFKQILKPKLSFNELKVLSQKGILSFHLNNFDIVKIWGNIFFYKNKFHYLKIIPNLSSKKKLKDYFKFFLKIDKRKLNKKIITFGTGKYSIFSRINSYIFNSPLVYLACDNNNRTANNQPTLEEFNELQENIK